MKLYVGNLPHSCSESELSELFTQAGSVVSARIISDRYTKQSRGFGFVEMSSREEGQKGIDELNGKEFQGRTIVVNEARPQERRDDRDRDRAPRRNFR